MQRRPLDSWAIVMALALTVGCQSGAANDSKRLENLEGHWDQDGDRLAIFQDLSFLLRQIIDKSGKHPIQITTSGVIHFDGNSVFLVSRLQLVEEVRNHDHWHKDGDISYDTLKYDYADFGTKWKRHGTAREFDPFPDLNK